MTDVEKIEYDELWITPEMYGQGYHEMVNGIVYHRDFTRSQVVRRDQEGNYLVRMPKRKNRD